MLLPAPRQKLLANVAVCPSWWVCPGGQELPSPACPAHSCLLAWLGLEAEPCSACEGFWQMLCRAVVPSRGLVSPGGFLQGFSHAEAISPPDPPVSADVEELWIGLNDLKLQMNFEWSDGTPVRFTYWHPFEPNNFRDSLEDCVTIWGPVRARGRVGDSSCTSAESAAASSWQGKGYLGGAPPAGVGHISSQLLGWKRSSTASWGIWCRGGLSVSPAWGWRGWGVPRAGGWAQCCSSPCCAGREVERQPVQPEPALHLQKARPGEPGEGGG